MHWSEVRILLVSDRQQLVPKVHRTACCMLIAVQKQALASSCRTNAKSLKRLGSIHDGAVR